MYLYKYLHKGLDNTNYRIDPLSHNEPQHINEVADYQNGRYLSAGEAVWQLLGYNVTRKNPSIKALSVHLPGKNYHQFKCQGGTQSTTSDLIRYFHHPLHLDFDNLQYTEYYSHYILLTWHPNQQLRNGDYLEIPHGGAQNIVHHQCSDIIVCLKSVSPTAGELFYLRAVLQHHHGCSYNELCTVHDVLYGSWHETATALGLFNTENEGHYALQEAVSTLNTPAQLHFLFARIILEGYPALPLWMEFSEFLSHNHTLQLSSNTLGHDQALRDLAYLLQDGS